MLDVVEPDEGMSVGKFVDLAAPVVQDILARGKVAILAGGTGLYMDALVRGHDFAPTADRELRRGCRLGPGRPEAKPSWRSFGRWTPKRPPGCTLPMKRG